jgi:hypothetical protein
MVRGRFNPDHFVPVRLFCFDPLGTGGQRDGDGENNGFLHAQVSTDSSIAPKNVGLRPAFPIADPTMVETSMPVSSAVASSENRSD